MGADMHFYVEKINAENKWEYIYLTDKNGNIISYYSRNYQLFGLLGGVRAIEHNILTRVRYLPFDVSDAVKEEHDKYEPDCHHSTWYTLSELYFMKEYLKLEQKNMLLSDYDEETKEEMNYEYDSLLTSLQNFCTIIDFIADTYWSFDPEKTRVILWFDN